MTQNKVYGFSKKMSEVEKYNYIKNQLIGKGFKPLNNITYTTKFDCRETVFPYTITIIHQTEKITLPHYKIAA